MYGVIALSHVEMELEPEKESVQDQTTKIQFAMEKQVKLKCVIWDNAVSSCLMG